MSKNSSLCLSSSQERPDMLLSNSKLKCLKWDEQTWTNLLHTYKVGYLIKTILEPSHPQQQVN